MDKLKKSSPTVCCLQETHIRRYTQNESEGLEESLPGKWKQNISGNCYTHIR